MYHIERNVAQGFLEITIVGFWEDSHFDEFVADLRAAIARFPAGGKPMTLYNYTQAAIQSQTVVAKMFALARHPSMVDRKVALYTERVLARQQARRVAAGRDNMRMFDSRDAALAFLLGTPEQDVPRPARPAPSRGSGAEGDGAGSPRSATLVAYPRRQAAPATFP